MPYDTQDQALAIAASLGCPVGAHKVEGGKWMPCRSRAAYETAKAKKSNSGDNMTDQTFKSSGKISHSISKHRIIGGWFSVFKYDGKTVVDSDNEEVDIASYTDVYIEFSKEYREANFDHVGEKRGSLVDNILIDSPEFAKMLVHEITGLPIDEIPVKRLGHFGSFQIDDPKDFEEALKGKLMFSIEGNCQRLEVDEDA